VTVMPPAPRKSFGRSRSRKDAGSSGCEGLRFRRHFERLPELRKRFGFARLQDDVTLPSAISYQPSAM
jgi:hypothetical protein